MILVLDASAMIAWLRNEPGADNVRWMLESHLCVAHAINLCEVYYDCLRTSGEEMAKSAMDDLFIAGIGVSEDLTRPFWEDVGNYKVSMRRISLGDCFALALTKRVAEGVLVTTDHGHFDAIAQAGICRVQFIR